MPAVGAEAVRDLVRQFARRAEHEHAAGFPLRLARLGDEMIEDRECEGGGLAGAGLSDADEVAAGEDGGDGGALDRGGGDVLLVGKGASDGCSEIESR